MLYKILYTQGEAAEDNRAHPGDIYQNDCKYDDVPFTDCDPFHLVKWRQMKLIFGGAHCESYKNETKSCSSDDFPPGKPFYSPIDLELETILVFIITEKFPVW